MATYKVIQDIESEDKLLGPLTLRQFVYAAIVVATGFIAFKLATISPFLVIPFLPPMIFFGTLAAPFGHDQSSEVWLLAKIRFFLKPRRRIWDQSGIQELVTITVPKKIEKHLTDGLSQTEVKSRLRALANTIDSRGWAVRNVNVNMFSQPSYLTATANDSDRLIENDSLPQEVPSTDITAADDILDATSNPTAQHMETMIAESAQAHRQALLATTQGRTTPTAQPPTDYWFMNQSITNTPVQPGYTTPSAGPLIFPGSPATPVDHKVPTSASEQELLEHIHMEHQRPNPAYGHTKILNPLGSSIPTTPTPAPLPPPPSPKAQDDQPTKTTIARLANNDDLNISTIAREASKATKLKPDQEVTISLR